MTKNAGMRNRWTMKTTKSNRLLVAASWYGQASPSDVAV